MEYVIEIEDVLSELGEDKTYRLLSGFSCPYNEDIQTFLRDTNKALHSSKANVAKTHLVIKPYENDILLLGYFTLCIKPLTMNRSKLQSKSRDKIKRYINEECRGDDIWQVSSYLIAQLGKNSNISCPIDGDRIMFHAIATIERAIKLVGTKIVFLECSNHPKLIDFYKKNEFSIYEDFEEQEPNLIKMIKIL